ncbi:MAG TPA: hypothetical protein IGS37_06995 [Synechococcales cyanobacterium M55_K2018_004]|nr:hypothetical protein [Synechococcales cyanobacterium M55_K2018_004]
MASVMVAAVAVATAIVLINWTLVDDAVVGEQRVNGQAGDSNMGVSDLAAIARLRQNWLTSRAIAFPP